ncbi:MAG: hypothetical protein IJ598_03285 [Ruminococcus sp.]|nr:hypothetical protein [Ruminococcus sp.]
MKRKMVIASLLALVILLCGCDLFAKSVKVTVVDSGKTVVAEGKDTMTVSELLMQAGVTLNQGDKTEPDGSVVWKDTDETQITVRRLATVSVTDGVTTQQVALLDSTVEQAIANAGFDISQYRYNGELTQRLTDGMTITLEKPQEGMVTENGVSRYYIDGVLQKDKIVGSDEDGYFYANSEGVIDTGYCDGVVENDTEWNVINGAATAVADDWDKTLFYALQAIAKCTNSSMTKEEKLKAAFDYIKTNYLEGVRHNPPYREADWPVVCANDLYVYGKGDCYSYGAAFAFMGKAIGCTEVYACNSGGHGWAEIEGKFYDPEWSMHSNKYTYFAVGANETDVAYSTVNENSDAWKRVQLS